MTQALTFILAVLVLVAAPLPAQTTAPADTANGVLLGSWKSQVAFDDVRIISGSKEVLADSFDRNINRWSPQRGDWQVTDGVYQQSSHAAPALASFSFRHQPGPYVFSVRARKLGGTEGFLIGFGARDAKNYCWLNLGGWGNTVSRLEIAIDGWRSPVGPRVPQTIETGRWYDIRIEVTGDRVQCFVDGRSIIDLTDPAFSEDRGNHMASGNDKDTFGQALIPDLVADPSIVEFDGVFYCYATTDGEGKHLSTSGLPVVWKSADFLNWSFEGSLFPPGFKGKYWAPSSAIRRDGTYYLYPTIDEHLTVVTAKSPEGPFLHPETQAPGWKVITTKAGGRIDAEVLIDDDGQGYMVWQRRGFGKMRPDLLDLEGSGQFVLPAKRNAYAEGQYIFKRKGIYYFMYTQGGDENYQYAYMLSRTGINGPWIEPEEDIISTTDHAKKIYGPGHGCFFCPKDSDQYYFIYLEYSRGSTNRQIYADKMNFNPDGTIQPITLTKEGVGAVRTPSDAPPNLALKGVATASSSRPPERIAPRQDRSLDRTEFFVPASAIDGCNGSRWMAAPDDQEPWLQVDLGEERDISATEVYFVQPTHGHAYRIEHSLDGKTWQAYGGNGEIRIQSPHRDQNALRARYLRVTILGGTPGIWEFRIHQLRRRLQEIDHADRRSVPPSSSRQTSNRPINS